jgi:hypothetical protein
MFKKITLIFILAVALGGFLVFRPYFFNKKAPATIEDRLPDGDFIGKLYVLDVARETSDLLYFNKVPFRDLLSYEFILSQGKQYGLDIQNPVYFFGNENGEWGALIPVSDSSKILDGVNRLRKFAEIEDTIVEDNRVFHYKKENAYLTYSSTYLLIYKGSKFSSIYQRVTYAKRHDISPTWKAFLKQKQFKDEKLVIYTNWKKLKDNGIQTAMFAHDSDSISFRLKAYIKNIKPLNVSMKKEGLNIQSNEQTSKMLNMHLDIQRLRKNPDDPLYKLLVKYGKKISFPVKEFLNAWEGDLSFREGGFQLAKETYIESVMDEDFNVSEVEKTKEVQVPGYTLLLSVNNQSNVLINKLFAKGIMRKEEGKFRFLFSPLLTMSTMDNYLLFRSGSGIPKTELSRKNDGIWVQKGTRIAFQLDSLSRREAFGSIYIPVQRLLRKNRFF